VSQIDQTYGHLLPDSGETLRWVVETDGKEVSDVDARERQEQDHPHVTVMLLVHADEEVEVGRW
jgi:hypothetical protein